MIRDRFEADWRNRLMAVLTGLWLPALPCLATQPPSQEAVVIDAVMVDGREQSAPTRSTGNANPRLLLPAGQHSLEIHYGPPGEKAPPLRLRYKLDGHDSAWREAGGEMQLSMLVLNAAGEVIALHNSPLAGDSDGWTNAPQGRRFTQRRDIIELAPEAATLRVIFSSGYWDTRRGASHPTVGMAMIDHCGLWRTNANGTPTNLWPNPDFEDGIDMDKPSGIPAGWQRGEFGTEMAKVLMLNDPDHRYVLALDDSNPRNGAEWRAELAVNVVSNEVLTVEWQELFTVGAAGERTAAYDYLEPGSYVFRVQPLTPTGELAGPETRLAFLIPQAFWKTAPFIGSAALFLIVLAWTVAQSMTRKRMTAALQRVDAQRVLERERARIARDIHDDLGSGLTRVALLSQSVRNSLEPSETVADDLDHIHQTAREMTRALDEIVWAVDPVHDTLDSIANYMGLYAQEFVSASGMECRLDFPPWFPGRPVPADIRHNLFLAFKEVLNNAVRHSGATRVTISLQADNNEVALTIGDNGRGFPVEEESVPPAAGRGSGGRGLRNLQSRMAQHEGTVEIVSQPGRGTTVRLRLPLPAALPAPR